MLAHVGWPTVGLAIVILIGRAIRDKDQTRRLIGLIVVLVAVVVGSVAICVELLGMQVPGFHVAAMTRAAAPVATASPRPAPPVAADPVATASPSASGVDPDESGRRARSVKPSRRAAAPPATRPARIRSGSPTPRVRARRSPGRWARAGLQPDVRSLQSGSPRLVTIWPWPRSRRHRTSSVGRRHPRRGIRDRAPRLRTRGRPVPARPVRPLSRSPGSQPSHQRTRLARPPRPGKSPGPPGRMYGNARSTRRLTSSRSPRPARPVRGRPWKADGAHRPSQGPNAVRYMSVDAATQRSTARTR